MPAGAKPWFEIPVFNWHAGHLSAIYQRQYIDSAQRFEAAPRLSAPHRQALDLLDALTNDPAPHFTMALQPGDMLFVHNHHLLHDRTAFEDWPEPERRRYLLRLWLAPADARPLPRGVCAALRQRDRGPARRRAGGLTSRIHVGAWRTRRCPLRLAPDHRLQVGRKPDTQRGQVVQHRAIHGLIVDRVVAMDDSIAHADGQATGRQLRQKRVVLLGQSRAQASPRISSCRSTPDLSSKFASYSTWFAEPMKATAASIAAIASNNSLGRRSAMDRLPRALDFRGEVGVADVARVDQIDFGAQQGLQGFGQVNQALCP